MPNREGNLPPQRVEEYEAIESDEEIINEEAINPHGTDYSPIRTHHEPLADRERRRSFIDEEREEGLEVEIPVQEKEKPVTWRDLPHKWQLAILTLARLAEPLVQSSLRSYIFYQLKSFDESLPDSTIASQAGIIQGAFSAAQLCTALLWGRVSDGAGRKSVLFIGLSGTCIACVGFGFSKKFWVAMIFRMMAGAFSGNIGVMRTMISEIVREKKYQSRAFLLLPMTGNIGTIIGPIIGGLLADPAANYPSLFGGIAWLEKYPYAAPNLVSAFFLFLALLAVIFGLDETHELFAHKEDWGRTLSRKIHVKYGQFRRKGTVYDGYTAIDSRPTTPTTPMSPFIPISPVSPAKPPKRVAPRYKQRLPFRRIFTYNVICTLISHGLLTGSIGTFNSIWYSFLSTPVYNPSSPPSNYTPHPPFTFTGGIGLPPRSVGLVMAILGTIGILLQLFLYPTINQRLGTILSWRIFLYCFPLAYFLSPFLSLIPSSTPPPSPKSGWKIWLGLCGVLFVQRIGQTFAGPATTILINNCSPHPSVLGTIHGIGQSASSAARTIGPAFGGWLYGEGLNIGMVGLMFWVLAGMSGVTCLASNWVREGDGHEIRLDGDDEAEEEADRRNRELGFR